MEKRAQKIRPIVTERAVTSATPVSSGTTGTYISPGFMGRRAFSGSPTILVGWLCSMEIPHSWNSDATVYMAPHPVPVPAPLTRPPFRTLSPRGATFNIVGPKNPAGMDGRVSSNIENVTSSARGSYQHALPERTPP